MSPRQRIDDIVRLFRQWNGGTDVSLPIRYALKKRREVDAIVVITDSETWAGRQHPVQTLREYREKINPSVRVVVLATTSTAGSVIPEDEPPRWLRRRRAPGGGGIRQGVTVFRW